MATRRILQMKHAPLVFMICIFLGTVLAGCDKVQQASDVIDKAQTFTDDLQKKVKAFIPGSDQKAGDVKGGESDQKERKKEKHGKDD
jgi:hypothetical protein